MIPEIALRFLEKEISLLPAAGAPLVLLMGLTKNLKVIKCKKIVASLNLPILRKIERIGKKGRATEFSNLVIVSLTDKEL